MQTAKVGKLRENQQLLHQAINEGLLTLGEPIMETITWHLKARGIFLESDEDVDVRVFYQHLEYIVGNIANMIMDEIYVNLRERAQHAPLQFNPSDPVVSRIEALMAVKTEGGSSS